MGLKDWLIGSQNTASLPIERYNQNLAPMDKAMGVPTGSVKGVYSKMGNDIRYPKSPEAYNDPNGELARVRMHEFQHWKQNSRGIVPQVGSDMVGVMKDTLMQGRIANPSYWKDPNEIEARNASALYNSAIGSGPTQRAPLSPLQYKNMNIIPKTNRFIEDQYKYDTTHKGYLENEKGWYPIK